MKNIFFLLVVGLSANSAFSQQQKWHDLEGYFQSPENKEMVARFTARDSILVANLLWNNAEIHLIRDTGLSFISKEMEDGSPIHIRFLRDASGAVSQVSVANSGVWTRLLNYTPHIKKAITHTPAQLQKFIGLYQLQEDTTRYVRLGVDSNTITIHQLWDGNVVDNFVPESALSFFKVEQPIFALNFSLDPGGRVTRFIAFGRDTWIRMGAQNITPARFKLYEGRYRSKDDPDNEIQLIATDSGLVVRQLWDKKEFAVQPVTNSYFYNNQRSYPLNIITDDQGQVKGVLLLGVQFFNKVNQ